MYTLCEHNLSCSPLYVVCHFVSHTNTLSSISAAAKSISFLLSIDIELSVLIDIRHNFQFNSIFFLQFFHIWTLFYARALEDHFRLNHQMPTAIALGSQCVWVLMVLQNRTQQIITAASSSQLREVNDDDDDDRDDNNNNDWQHQNDEKPIIFLLVYGVCLSVCVYGKHKQKKLTV